MSYNGSIGADLGEIGTGVVATTFFACIFEGNQGNGIANLEHAGTGITAQSANRLEILSCYFEVAPEGAVQFVHLGSCLGAVVDSCYFQGGSELETQPERAVKFVNTAFGRFTNNTVEGVSSEIVLFGINCDNAIEFANRDMNPVEGYARIRIDGFKVLGFSRGSLGITRHVDQDSLPKPETNPQPGSLAWVDEPDEGEKNLRVWDGSSWRGIDLV